MENGQPFQGCRAQEKPQQLHQAIFQTPRSFWNQHWTWSTSDPVLPDKQKTAQDVNGKGNDHNSFQGTKILGSYHLDPNYTSTNSVNASSYTPYHNCEDNQLSVASTAQNQDQ